MHKIITPLQVDLNALQSISFSGCGFNFYYHCGVIRYLQKNNIKVDRIYGTSLGAFVAAMYACNIDIRELLKANADWQQSLTSKRDVTRTLNSHIKNIFNRFFTRSDMYLQVNDKLFINMTQVPNLKHITVSTYCSNQDLLDAIFASQYIPLWTGLKPYYYFRGMRCVDGGLLRNYNGDDSSLYVIATKPSEQKSAGIMKAVWSLFPGWQRDHVAQYITSNHTSGYTCFTPQPIKFYSRIFYEGRVHIKRYLESLWSKRKNKLLEDGEKPKR